jgi:hypothetical protein
VVHRGGLRAEDPNAGRDPRASGRGGRGLPDMVPGGGELADHDQHALITVRTAPTDRERGQLLGGRVALPVC